MATGPRSTAQVRVSALIPVRDGGPLFRTVLSSVLAQDLDSFEVVVVDDGSSDETPDVLRHAAAVDARVKVLTTGGVGQPKAMNLGLQHCEGEWVARVDADDVCLPSRFSLQATAGDAEPGTVLVSGDYWWVDESDSVVMPGLVPLTGRSARISLARSNRLPHPLAMYRREAALEAGAYNEDESTSEDLGLWMRLLQLGQYTAVPEPVVRVMIRTTSISASRRATQHRVAQAIRAAYPVSQETLQAELAYHRDTLGLHGRHRETDTRNLLYWRDVTAACRRTGIRGTGAVGAFQWAALSARTLIRMRDLRALRATRRRRSAVAGVRSGGHDGAGA